MNQHPILELPQPVFEPASDSEPIRRLELHVTYRCVNECVFCSEREHRRAFADHPATIEEIGRVLESKRAEGYEHVTFTGGEPTLFPKIWLAFKAAKALGYRTFLISNGAALALSDFSAKALPYLDEVCLSVHGHDATMHGALTRNPKSFERVCRAFDHVREHPGSPFLMVNCVVNRMNLPHLPEILRFAADRGEVKHFLLSQTAPMGAALPIYGRLAPRYDEIVEHLPELLRIAQERGVVLRLCGTPVCVLGDYWRCANDLYFSPRLTVSRSSLPDGKIGWLEETGRRPTAQRFYPAACGKCPIRGRCGGVYKKYWEEIEQPELTPFDPEGKCRS